MQFDHQQNVHLVKKKGYPLIGDAEKENTNLKKNDKCLIFL